MAGEIRPASVESLGRDLLNVPMGDMISQMAASIAQAQFDLDTSSIRVAQMMSGTIQNVAEDGKLLDSIDSRVYFGKDKDGNPNKVSMVELGFTPNFYQFIDTLLEVKVSIKITSESASEEKSKGFKGTFFKTGNNFRITITPVDATYSNKYSYSAEGSSVLRTKMAPVPPPAILEERIREMMGEKEK